MKRFMALILTLALLVSALPALAGGEYDGCLWFLRGGEAPEQTGASVALWYIRKNGASFQNELVPENRRPSDLQDIGYVVVVQEGNPSFIGTYSNGSRGLRYSVDLIAYDVRTGAEITRANVLGGDPPQTTTSSAFDIYGAWPSDQEIAASVEGICASLSEESVDTSLWEYVIYDEESVRFYSDEYRTTSEECLQYLTLDAGVEILKYNGYQSGTLVVPDVIEGVPVVAIGRDVFEYAHFDEIILPDTVTRIGEDAFRNCYVERLTLPDGVTLIPYGALLNVFAEEIHLPAGLKAIAYNAMGGNPNARTFDLPEGLERVDPVAFWGCWSLQTLTLPRSLNALSVDAFMECESLTVRVYKDSWAYSFFMEGGWEDALQAYADELGYAVSELGYITKPACEGIGE